MKIKRIVKEAVMVGLMFSLTASCACAGTAVKESEAEPIDIANISPVTQEQINADLKLDNFESIECGSHALELTDETSSNYGMYDASDSIEIKIRTVDALPQTITKEVCYKRVAETGEWEITSAKYKDWKIDYKKFGGTAWKFEDSDGIHYIRMRDTIEFFNVKYDKNSATASSADFTTTILGAMSVNAGGETSLRRTHVMSGTISEDGTIILKGEFVNEKEPMEIKLNECTRVTYEELPFTEEEFREASDQNG